IHCFFLFFFFSSRRRHTRCLSDWSSDVCSSDLAAIDLDVLVFLLGVMLIVGYLEVGKFFEWAAEWVLRRARTPQRLLFGVVVGRSEEHTSELQSLRHLVCRLLLEKKKKGNVIQT